jgi:PAS domain S-box-containing protein
LGHIPKHLAGYDQGQILQVNRPHKHLAVLTRSEDLLRAVFNQTYQFIGLLSPDGVLLEVNDTALKFIDQSADKVIGKLFWETPWWNHSPKLQNEVRRAVFEASNGRFVRMQVSHADPQGELHWIDFSIKPYLNEQGKVTYLIPEGRDVSELRQAEEELRRNKELLEDMVATRNDDLNKLRKEVEARKAIQRALASSEKRFMDVFYTSPDAILLIDLDTFVDCNQATVTMLRADDKKAVLSTHPSELSPPVQPDGQPSRAKANQMIATAFEKGVHRFEWVHCRTDGERFPVEVSLISIALGGKQMLYCVWRDLTEQKAAERELDSHREHLEELVAERTNELESANLELKREIKDRERTENALRRSEERYRILFSSISDFIYTHDLDGKILTINPLAAKSLGYEPEELQGRNLAEFMPPHLRDTIKSEFIPKILENGHSEGVLTLHDNNGQTRYLDYRSVLMRDMSSEPYVSGSGRDVTEKMLAERERTAIQEQLQQAQKMEAVGTLASGVAHDFNNVLQGITGYVELLARSDNLNTKEQGYLSEVLRSSERASQMVKHLLTFSSKAPLALSNLDLNVEIRHVVGLLMRTIPKMVTIEFQAGQDLNPVKGDAAQIEQLILNLGINARDAMPEGGKLFFETSNVELDESYRQTHFGVKPGSYVLLSVTDNGMGMDKETQKHMYEPFYTTKAKGKGTGLGLATVFGIVKGHQGFINCYSEPGLGTTFNIYLPTAAPAAKLDQAKTGPDLERLQGSETILLVDDEEPIRTLGSNFLSQFGYLVITANSGEKALEIFRDTPLIFDLVIMDLGMPGMGGKKCLEQLKKLDPELKVVISSGYLLESAELEAQADGFINKPYHLRDMALKVRSILDSG